MLMMTLPNLPRLARSLPKTTMFIAAVGLYSWLSPQVALGESATALPPAAAESTALNIVSNTPTMAPASESFTSNGAPLRLEALGITMSPPAGWLVDTNTGSLSVVMREPKATVPDYEKAKYQRNITVAAIHRASPIDEKRALELQGELIKSFSADSSVSNFQILEHKFFNYRGVNDGLLVYSSMNLGEYPMMQMHVLVSGQEKQFLMTYTDLAERFNNAKDGTFERAWNSLVSIDVTGAAPSRMNDYLRYGALGAGFLLLGLAGILVRMRGRRVEYVTEGEEFSESGRDTLSGSNIATLAGDWRLSSDFGDSDGEVSGIEFTNFGETVQGDGHQSALSHTRQTEYISNF